MILNAYAVLDLALSGSRLLLALLIVALAVRAWRHARLLPSPGEREALEDHTYLVSLLGVLLLVLNLLAWPLLYLLLQSYIAEWPGVMCIYGVTRIGSGTSGATRFLPHLLTALQVGKPTLLFVGGAWFVLYLANRATQTAPLAQRVLAALIVLGVAGALDAACESAYLLIPKRAPSLSTGCCTTAFDDPGATGLIVSEPVLGVIDRPALTVGYFALNGAMVLALSAAVARRRLRQRAVLALVLIATLPTLAVSMAFLVDVVAPMVLHLPYHHCPYDLIPMAPETVLAVALLCWGTCCVGWAYVVTRWGDCAESRPWLAAAVPVLLRLARFGYLASLVMITVELAVA